MVEWLDNVSNEALQTEEAKTALSKYDSMESAVVGGLEAQKMVGKPFRLPESLDKLPDDTVRGDFVSQVSKLTGVDITAAKAKMGDILKGDDDFKDIDFSEGLEEGDSPMSEAGQASLKKFLVESGATKTTAKKVVGFVNGLMKQARADQQQQIKQMAEDTHKALVDHFGGEDKVTEMSEAVKRAFMSKAANKEEFEKTGLALIQSALTRHPQIAIPLMEMIAPYGKEGSTKTGDGGDHNNNDAPKSTAEQLPNTAKALGW